MKRGRTERGSVTLLLVLIMPALFIGVAGLVFDGGQVVTARRQALNEAEQAARAGAQGVAIEEVRGGGVQELDPARAQAAAEEYLAQLGRDGDVEVDGDRVRVTVRITRTRQILPLGPVTVSATAEARNVRGVVEAES
ncbi:MAG: TadE/TadG family type IV pilus assembly protein [Acidimicrobiales bacterium]